MSALKPRRSREGLQMESQGQNGTREIRPYRIVGGPGEMWPKRRARPGSIPTRDERGACRNVNYGGTRNPPHNRKGAGRKLSTYGCARCISTRPYFQQGLAATCQDCYV